MWAGVAPSTGEVGDGGANQQREDEGTKEGECYSFHFTDSSFANMGHTCTVKYLFFRTMGF